MKANLVTERLCIGGMTCTSCADRIEKKLGGTAGVVQVRADYQSGMAEISYNEEEVSRAKLEKAVEKLGYKLVPPGERARSAAGQLAGLALMVLAVYLLLQHMGFTALFQNFPQAQRGMGYGMLFVVGLLTSVHCVGMCGGISLTQCLPVGEREEGRMASLRASLLYNAGRVIAYTAVGAVVGALGSVISFSGAFKGVIQIVAGVFMVLMGANMLGIFPALRALVPRLPGRFSRGVRRRRGEAGSPLYIGLLNGLMPCGPLQAMQLYALSTADPIQGALSMLLFSLGTVPLMFSFGAASSLLSRRFTAQVMRVGAVLVAVMGVAMLHNGMSLSGISLGGTGGEGYRATVSGGVQTVQTPLSPGRYETITVEAGVPVVWTITAGEGTINGCNNRIIIPAYGLEKRLEYGENVIAFTPEQPGNINYSCWMGMIRGSITVVEGTQTEHSQEESA